MPNYKEDWMGDNTMDDVKDILGSILTPSFKELSKDALIFEAGVFEAVKRYIKKRGYIDKDILLALIGEGKEDE